METILLSTANSPENTLGDPFLSGSAITPIISLLSVTKLYLFWQAGRNWKCNGKSLLAADETDMFCWKIKK